MSDERTRPAEDSWKKTACILCSINCGLKVQTEGRRITKIIGCLLYTSDAADEYQRV